MNEHLVDRGREDVDGYSEVLYFLRRKLIEPIMEAHPQLFTVSAEYRVAALCEGNYAAAAILRQRFLADTAVFYELIDDGAELLLGHAQALAHARDIRGVFVLQQEQYEKMIRRNRGGGLPEKALMQGIKCLHKFFG